MGTINRSKWAIWAGTACLLAFAGLPSSANAGASQLASGRNPAIPLSIPGNGSSGSPIISPDGRYVVFVSGANDLVPGDNNLLLADVFLRDRQAGTTVLVSTNFNGTGGGNGNSLVYGMSTNARYVLFESDASDLVPADTNGVTDIFVRDVVAGTTTLVSVSTNGSSGNGASSRPAMTPDGRYVAFVSLASTLVPGDINAIADVFVRDLVAGTTTLASPGATFVTANVVNVMDSPVITPDGRYVTFVSTAKNLAAGMTVFPGDIFLRDLQSATTTWVSTNHPSSNYPSSHPVISDDGRFVAFKQTVTNTPNAFIYRYDSIAAASTEINTNSAGVSQTNGISPPYVDDAMGPVMTADGRFVFFAGSSNTVPVALFEWDGQSLVTVPVSLDNSGSIPSNTFSHTPVLSSDGRFLAFLNNAPNMAGNIVSNGYHLYLRDLQLGTNYLVDADTNGIGSADTTGATPAISSDGRYIAFNSADAGFVTGDNNRVLDVFLRDINVGATELISLRNTNVISQTGSGMSLISRASISLDARWLVFTSYSSDLVPNDNNGEPDVFLRDLQTGSNILVSVGLDSLPAKGGQSGNSSMTADNRYVYFISGATNIVANDTNLAADIFIRDLQTGATAAAFANTIGGSLGSGDCSALTISSDGRFMAFLCRTNATITNTFWRDIVADQTVVLTNVNSTLPPSMSANGRYVLFSDASSRAYVRDMQTGTNIFSTVGASTFAMLSPDGSKIMTGGTAQMSITAIPGSSNIMTFTSPPTVGQSPVQWSADSRYVALVALNLAPPDNSFSNDVYLFDTQAKTTTLISRNSANTGPGNGASEMPAVNGDGRFVVYRSFATDLVPGTTNPPNVFIYDRFTGSNSLLTVASSPLPAWSSWISRPAVSWQGGSISYQAMKAGLVSGVVDLNRTWDVFAATQTPQPFTDSDSDGIPDAWLVEYFGHATGQAGDLSLAQADADGDGMSNLQEYLTGTNPRNVNSVFRLQISAVINSMNVSLTWSSIPGKSYRIQFKNGLEDPDWQDLTGDLPAAGPQTSYAAPSNLVGRYYRVVSLN